MPRRRTSGLLTRAEDSGLRFAQVAMLMSLFALTGIVLATITP